MTGRGPGHARVEDATEAMLGPGRRQDPAEDAHRAMTLHTRSIMSRWSFLLMTACLLVATPLGGQVVYDVIIRNGKVLDGTGNPWFRADVAIVGDRIAAVGDLSQARSRNEIDATNLFVTPGFIDTHTHAGGGLGTEELSHARPLLVQGITTILANPDGGGPTDLAAQRAQLLEHGLGVNVGQMIGHGSVRREVLGMEDRAPTPAELEQMLEIVRAAMEEGAWGLSSGPFYTPGFYAETDEIAALARVAAEYGGVHQSHVRDESDYTVGVVAGLEEVIEVSRQAGLPGIHTHIKVLGPPVWGFSQALIHRIERARAEGLEIYADQYPYLASATGLSAALLPRWAQAGGGDSLQARIDDPETMAAIREAMVENLARRGGADAIQFRRFRPDPTIEGMKLDELARERGMDPIDLAVELLRQGSVSIVSFNMHPDDVANFMRQPWTMTSSDGDLVPWQVGVPHPRSYGAFSRKIARYVMEEGVIDLVFAIRSMTSLPAQVFHMEDRGMLREGLVADIAVFDPARVKDLATFTDPHQLSVGMSYVFVNGETAILDGEATGVLAGRVLRRER